jgi:hypothetical protein
MEAHSTWTANRPEAQPLASTLNCRFSPPPLPLLFHWSGADRLVFQMSRCNLHWPWCHFHTTTYLPASSTLPNRHGLDNA